MKLSGIAIAGVVVLVVVATVPAVVGVASYNGICVFQPRQTDELAYSQAISFLLDEQSFIEITEDSENGTSSLKSSWKKAGVDLKPYRNVAEFVEANPQCCAMQPVGAEGDTPTWDERITGRVARFVKLTYAARLITTGYGERRVTREAFYGVSNCGVVHRNF